MVKTKVGAGGGGGGGERWRVEGVTIFLICFFNLQPFTHSGSRIKIGQPEPEIDVVSHS